VTSAGQQRRNKKRAKHILRLVYAFVMPSYNSLESPISGSEKLLLLIAQNRDPAAF
jgi:hypothetical protein